MSNLLSQASLVMIPSGYKEDVVYSQIPTNGNGDLSFTRASNGTRTNSAGLVEVCPWNLVQNSENFDAVWTKYNGATITTEAIVAPNGTTTADLLIAGASQEIYSANMPKVAEELVYTFSCYAKLYNTNVFKMTASDFSTSGVDASFNLSTLSATYVTGATWSNSSASIESVGNGWYKCILTSKSPATTGLYLSLYTSGTNSVSGVYIWGCQVNIGSTAKPYFPTTDRLNVPRLTYQNGGGGCPSLLLEKQSTNFQTYSQDFTNVAWTKLGQGVGDTAVVTANYAISPDGTQNATRFVCNLNGGTTSSDRSWMIASFTAQATSTISIWIKLNSAGTKTVLLSDSGGGTKTISGTDWQRIDATFVGAGGEFRIGLIGGSTSDTLDCCIWGAQAESGSYPTSYIGPTTSASATRVADVAQKTGISSLIGQTEGTIFLDYNLISASQDIVVMNAVGLPNNDIAIIFIGNSLEIYCFNNFVEQFRFSLNGYKNTNRYKIAIGYANNNTACYINGSLVGTDTSCSFNLTDSIFYTSADYNAHKINESVLFKTRLTNAELASLTTI
jgi:hypothetical protein